MPQLAKAKLIPLKAGKNPSVAGPEVPVQFNPETLRITRTNQYDGGRTRGHQVRQYAGTSSTKFSLELYFDTADEARPDGSARSVRERTAIVERYVQPQTGGETPPKLRFVWGDLVVDGIVESVSIELTHFAASGVPLRAKVDLEFKEQDASLQANALGPGAKSTRKRDEDEAAPTRSARALGGESLPAFAQRQGLAPQAWRTLAGAAASGLTLDAGVELGFSAEASLSVGVAAQASVELGIGASLEATVGLEVGVDLSAQVSGDLGFRVSAEGARSRVLSEYGGVSQALARVDEDKARRAEADTLRGFGVDPPSPVTALQRADKQASNALSARLLVSSPQKGPAANGLPLRTSAASAARRAAATPVADPFELDPRSLGFGLGLPLKPRLGRSSRGALPPTSADPTSAPWDALPARALGSAGSESGAPLRGESCRCSDRRNRRWG